MKISIASVTSSDGGTGAGVEGGCRLVALGYGITSALTPEVTKLEQARSRQTAMTETMRFHLVIDRLLTFSRF